jgi:hypothetical protein
LTRAKPNVERGPAGRPLRPAKSASKITNATLSLTKDQVREITNLGVTSIDKLLKEKRLKKVPNIGRRVLITMESVKEVFGPTVLPLMVLVTLLAAAIA